MTEEEIIGTWFKRFWTKKHLLTLVDTLEIGIEARASRNRHTGDLTDDDNLFLSSLIEYIRKLVR
jgi:hypothetical protein